MFVEFYDVDHSPRAHEDNMTLVLSESVISGVIGSKPEKQT